MVGKNLMSKIVAVTGHRPGKIFYKAKHSDLYSAFNAELLTEFAAKTIINYGPKRIITGMALGWDQAVARACVKLKIPYTAAIPCDAENHCGRWPGASKEEYSKLLSLAESVHVVTPGGYHPGKMQTRNEWMVDEGESLVALFDGVKQGGTWNCVKYSLGRKNIYCVWDDWVDFYEQVMA